VFNVWEGTVFKGTHRTPVELLRLLDSVVDKEKHTWIARRLRWQRAWVIEVTRRLEQEEFVQQLRDARGQGGEKVNGIWPSDISKLLGKIHRATKEASRHAEEPP
jgi:hypothetical protein